MAYNDGNVLMENMRIVFRNFAGKEGMYNREGDRNFAVLLDDPQLVEDMQRDGWNIKFLKPREEGDEPQAYIQVAVSFKGRPPNVVLITSRGRTTLSEDELELLDWADIANVDLIIRPYNWNVSGKTGVKAYLKSLFVTIEEDALDLKYNDVPEIGELPATNRLAIEAGEDPDIIEGEIVDEGPPWDDD